MEVSFRKMLKIESGANNNKWYEFHPSKDGKTFEAKYGRVGYEGVSKTYPISDFDKKYREKIKKGYEDITEIVSEIKTVSNQIISKEKEVEELILQLQKYANINNRNTYLYSDSVTKYQLEYAQKSIDKLTNSFNNHYNKNWDVNSFNAELLNLYKIIPRKMKKVVDHLIVNETSKDEILELIGNEQNNLDSLSSSYTANNIAETNDVDNNIDLLESLGLKISFELSKKERDEVYEMMNESKHQINRIYKVENKNTQEKFDDFLKTQRNKKTQLLFHGSRNQSWWFILQQGLKIRPANAVFTADMFGTGIYGAAKAKKSIGYTSLNGSYWARGNDKKGYLALFEYHLGKQKIVYYGEKFSYDRLQKDGYDSVYAKAGKSLYNDEFIVYTENQATIKYLIEIK